MLTIGRSASWLCCIVFVVALGGCEDLTSPGGGVPELKVPGQRLSGMIVRTGGGGLQYYVTSETLLARGGSPLSSYSWSVASQSALPAGTTVSPLTGVFHSSGGALVEGVHEFRMTVSDGSRTATGDFTFEVNEYQGFGPLVVFQQPLGVGHMNLPDASGGHGYGASLWALGDGALPWSWQLSTGSLPQGLVVDQASGVVRGTPHSTAVGGEYVFSVVVRDRTGEAAVSDPLLYHIRVR